MSSDAGKAAQKEVAVQQLFLGKTIAHLSKTLKLVEIAKKEGESYRKKISGGFKGDLAQKHLNNINKLIEEITTHIEIALSLLGEDFDVAVDFPNDYLEDLKYINGRMESLIKNNADSIGKLKEVVNELITGKMDAERNSNYPEFQADQLMEVIKEFILKCSIEKNLAQQEKMIVQQKLGDKHLSEACHSFFKVLQKEFAGELSHLFIGEEDEEWVREIDRKKVEIKAKKVTFTLHKKMKKNDKSNKIPVKIVFNYNSLEDVYSMYYDPNFSFHSRDGVLEVLFDKVIKNKEYISRWSGA